MSILLTAACSQSGVEDDKLGFIDADVKNENTNFVSKARFGDYLPGNSAMLNRSFENAPPLIPHTTKGFLPITKKRNVCLSCHLPEKAKKVGAVPLSKTHFFNIRPKLVLVNGVYQNPKDVVTIQKLKKLNNAYFNCSQCHAAQTNVSIDIKNLFSPEFRKDLSDHQSDLKNKINEGL